MTMLRVQSQPGKSQPPIPAEAPRILIVEDEGIVALDIAEKLKSMGYMPVGIAGTGEEAVAKTEDLHPDLVLMDIRLQGEMDGIAAAAQIKRRLSIPVVYLTAYGDEHTLARAKATNPFGYLLKPYHEKDLRTTLFIALYRQKMERTLHRQIRRLEDRERRQIVIAELGVKALSGADVSPLFQEALSRVVQDLEVDHGAVFELLKDQNALAFRAAVGWPEGIMALPALEVGGNTLAGYTLQAREPVVVFDLPGEKRFTSWKPALDLGMVSAVSVVMRAGERVFGALLVSTARPWVFARNDIAYLQSLANVLTTAMLRKDSEQRLE